MKRDESQTRNAGPNVLRQRQNVQFKTKMILVTFCENKMNVRHMNHQDKCLFTVDSSISAGGTFTAGTAPFKTISETSASLPWSLFLIHYLKLRQTFLNYIITSMYLKSDISLSLSLSLTCISTNTE
jgi:hypothetical protein